jgi:ketosteroid isomerase-like protein
MLMKTNRALQTVAALATALLTQLSVAQPARAVRPSAQEAIAVMNHQFEQAFAAGDAAAIADQYTKDAQSLQERLSPIFGRIAIKEGWEHTLGAIKGARAAVRTTELQEAGDWAYETDNVSITFHNGRVSESKWLLIRKFEDGKWRIHREMGNDSPSSGLPTDEQILRDLVQRENDGKLVLNPTDDLIFVSGLYPRPFVGRQAYEAGRMKDEDMATMRPNQTVKHQVVRLVVSESKDIAYEYGNHTINWDDQNKKRTGFDGAYLRVWRRDRGEWKTDVLFCRPNEEEKPDLTQTPSKPAGQAREPNLN